MTPFQLWPEVTLNLCAAGVWEKRVCASICCNETGFTNVITAGFFCAIIVVVILCFAASIHSLVFVLTCLALACFPDVEIWKKFIANLKREFHERFSGSKPRTKIWRNERQETGYLRKHDVWASRNTLHALQMLQSTFCTDQNANVNTLHLFLHVLWMPRQANCSCADTCLSPNWLFSRALHLLPAVFGKTSFLQFWRIEF